MIRVVVALVLACVLTTIPCAVGAESLLAERLPRITYRGGPFLKHPRIVTVTFAGDDAALVARLVRFGDAITRGAWWRSVTDGYCTKDGTCVRDGRPAAHVVLNASLPSPLEATTLAAILTDAIGAGRLAPLDAESLLLVYLPADVALRDATHPRYCGDGPRGFHRALRLPNGNLPWAVLPRCGELDDLTATASHEILEAVTNPDPSRRGFAFVPDSASRGFTAAGVEPVDPCGLITRNGHRTTADGFVVQRAWSNRAAAQGGDPCVPAANARSYRALIPDQPIVRLRTVGTRATVTLTAVAVDRDAPSWTISAIDLAADANGAFVDAALDRAEVRAGDTVTLTLTARRKHPRASTVIGVVSRVGDREHLWPIAVSLR